MRVTCKQLEKKAKTLNDVYNKGQQELYKGKRGNRKPVDGVFFIDKTISGYSLQRMSASGGTSMVVYGYQPAGMLMELMTAYMQGARDYQHGVIKTQRVAKKRV